jgi:cytochrome c biogenesis protein CcmG/thiol:disulfide interchange protein DsbE
MGTWKRVIPAVALAVTMLCALAGCSSEQASSSSAAPNTGASASGQESTPAADFVVVDAQGNEVSLSSFRGKPVVVNFWTSWCTYCKQEIPDFQNAYDAYGDRVEFMMVNSTSDSQETLKKAQAYLDEGGYTFPCYFDTTGQAVQAYQLQGYPTTYVIDAQGNIATYSIGAMTEENLMSALEDVS